ncbi:MAG: hypothetical protein WC340_15635 [Kiritimatiellia bacterium]
MGAKGRKKKQKIRAKNRTGLLKNISGFHSLNQRNKRVIRAQKRVIEMKKLKRLFGF